MIKTNGVDLGQALRTKIPKIMSSNHFSERAKPQTNLKKSLKPKQKRLVFVSIALVSSLLALGFIWFSFRQNMVFFYSPKELLELQQQNKLAKIIDKKIKIRAGGMVIKGSITKINGLSTEFVISDYEQNLKIRYFGLLPDLFRDGQGVVANGFLTGSLEGVFKDGEDLRNGTEGLVFISDELLVKHDENYMPPEVAKALEGKMPK